MQEQRQKTDKIRQDTDKATNTRQDKDTKIERETDKQATPRQIKLQRQKATRSEQINVSSLIGRCKTNKC